MPHSLAELLETRQALEVIPGVLYFASVGERLRSLAEPPAPAAHIANVSPRDKIEVSAARAAIEASMRGAPRVSHRRGRSEAAKSLLLRQMMLRDTNGDANFCGELENGVFYVSVGESPSFQYHSFFADFGPLGLNSVTRLSRCLEGLLRCCAAYSWSADNDNTTSNNNVSGGVFGPRPGGGGAESNKTGGGCADKATSHGNIPIVFCSGMKNHERANAACLLACFCVATLRWTASVTWHIFQHAYPPLIPFRDAGCGVSTFPLGILDVISGLEKAVAFGWYDVRTFDLAEYERLRRCDCSWVVPHMFLALSSPNKDIPCRSPKVYTKLFQQLKVTLLVRLNEPLYRRETFLASGIQHVDLQFPDGTAPNDDIINRFLKTVEPIVLPQEQRIKKRQDKQTSPNNYHHHHHHGIHRKQVKKNNLLQGDKTVEEKKHMSGGAIAMHCHAGLGRTGTLICVYLIRHCGFTARESIGWTRLCRPGSVIGVQQSFLERLEWRITPFAKKSRMMRGNLDQRMYGSRSVSAGSNYTCEIRDTRQAMKSSSPTLPTTTAAAAAAAVTGCRPATAITMATTKNTAEQLLLLKQQQQRAVVYDTSCARRVSLTEIFKNPSSFFIELKKKTSSHHNYVGKLLRSVGEQQQQQQYTEGNHSLMTGQGGGSTTNTQTDVWMSSEEKAAPQFPVAHMSLQQSQPQPAMPSLAASHAANPAKQEDNESNTQERLVLLPGNDDHINRSQKSHQTQLIPSHPNLLSILFSATTSTAPWQAPTVTAEVQAIGQSSRLQKERRVITMMGNSNTSNNTSNNTNNNNNNNVAVVKHVDMDLVNNVDPQFRLSGFTISTNMSPNDENKSMTSAAARCLRVSPSSGPPFRTTRLAARKHLQREETTLLTREEVEAVATAATDPGWGGMAVRLAPWKKKKYI